MRRCDPEWSFYQQATAGCVEPEQKRKEGKHDQPLPRDASEILVPLFERLSKPGLFERCMSLGTSNANESLHSVIWKRAPKTVFSSRKTVEIVVGIVQFNKGAQMLVDATTAVIPQAGPSRQLSALAVKMYQERLRQADAAANLESKSSRKRRALLKLQANKSKQRRRVISITLVLGNSEL